MKKFQVALGLAVLVPDSHSDLHGAQGFYSTEDSHYKRTKIILNPDHDKLGSFDNPLENPSNDPELKNGTRVLLNNIPVVYVWQDGKLVANIDEVAIDQIDKNTDEILAETR